MSNSSTSKVPWNHGTKELKVNLTELIYESVELPAGTKIWPVRTRIGTATIWASGHEYLDVPVLIEKFAVIPDNPKFSRFHEQNKKLLPVGGFPSAHTHAHSYIIGQFPELLRDDSDPVGVHIVGFIFDSGRFDMIVPMTKGSTQTAGWNTVQGGPPSIPVLPNKP